MLFEDCTASIFRVIDLGQVDAEGMSIILSQTRFSHPEDEGSTFPKKVCNTCCETQKMTII
jgi:hypothetical protein